MISRFGRIWASQAGYALVWAVVLGLVFSGVQIYGDYREFARSERDTAMSVLNMLREPATQAAYHLNPEAAGAVVSSLLQYGPAIEARLVDDFGEELAGKSRPTGNGVFHLNVGRIFGAGVEYRLDLFYGSQRQSVGHLELDIDRAALMQRFIAHSGDIVLLGLVRNLVLAVFLGTTFYFTLARPLVAMTRRVAGFAPETTSGDLLEEARRPDELGQLATAFNRYVGAADEQLRLRREAQASLAESERRYRQIVETAEEGVWLVDENGLTTLANAKMASILGTTVEEMVGKSLFDFMDEEGRAIASVNFEPRRAGLRERHEFRFLRRDGASIWTELSTSPMFGDDGSFRGALAMVTDITARREAAEALHASNLSLRSTIADIERNREELRIISQINALVQLAASEEEAFRVIEQHAEKLFAPHGGAISIVGEDGYLECKAQWHAPDWALQRFAVEGCEAVRRGHAHNNPGEAGKPYCAHLGRLPVGGVWCFPMVVEGDLLGVLHVEGGGGGDALGDVWQQRVDLFAESVKLGLSNVRLRCALREQAVRDPLTGLGNRRQLDEALAREIARATRTGMPLCVAMIDIDFFKRFNDQFGHETGDRVLREVAALLEEEFRAGDVACRFGGEEFVCLLPGLDVEAATPRFMNLQRRVRSLRDANDRGQGAGLTISIGLAAYPKDGGDGESIIRAADSALYDAKQGGRDCIRVFGMQPAASASN